MQLNTKNKQNFEKRAKNFEIREKRKKKKFFKYLVRDDELIQVDHDEVLYAAHVPVQAVIECCKQPLSPDLLLTLHVQSPGEEGQQPSPGVVREQTRDLGAHSVLIHREPE